MSKRMETDIEKTKRDIESTDDLLERALKLSGVVSRIFAEVGWPLVVVGGSAVEFYTEGVYMSGDIDFCRRRHAAIPPRLAQDLMSRLGGEGGPRNWKVCGMFVDLLGVLENEARTELREIQTPYGAVTLVPFELVLVERLFTAVYPTRRESDYAVAKKLAARAFANPEICDWNETSRIAGLPEFGIVRELEALKTEVGNEP